MKIALLDRSLYFKGLLLLIRKDRDIRDEEENLMMRIGQVLGFESDFCANAIDEILHNRHIVDSPPLFSKQGIAICFLRDGLRLSAADGQTHKAELDWLQSVAQHNGLGAWWAEESARLDLTRPAESLEEGLELEHLEWE